MIAFLPVITAGLLTGLSLIIAIGAQNAFVIRQGLTKQHVLLVVAICAAADAVLIFLGVGGLGAIIQGLPWLLEVIRWFGVVYLTWFGIKSVRSVFKEQALDASGVQSGSAGKAVAAVLGFTFLNPHVYLDTVILLGSIGNQFGEGKWLFAVGASLDSVLWFSAIGFGAKAASGVMKKPAFWKVLDSIIAAVMISIAIVLAVYKFEAYCMDEQQLMSTFSVLSFSVLGLGAIVLSLVTLLGRGNRSFAVITAAATIFLGAFMWFVLAPEGILPTVLGVIALVLSLWPRKKRAETKDED